MNLLFQLATFIRNSRLARGALELESVEIKFDLNASKIPTNIHTKTDLPVNKMVAEWMIFANVAVAKKIHQHFPFSSLLRNHPEPRERDFDALRRCVETLGMTIDLSTNKTLANSLVEVINCVSPETANIILMMATYAMSEARYFSSGTTPVSHFYHYGLACDYYTHFTSPIR